MFKDIISPPRIFKDPRITSNGKYRYRLLYTQTQDRNTLKLKMVPLCLKPTASVIKRNKSSHLIIILKSNGHGRVLSTVKLPNVNHAT